MMTNGNGADDAIADNDDDVADVRKVGVGVAAVRTPTASVSGRGYWPAMQNYVALISDRTPLWAVPLPLVQNVPATVAARIAQLPSRFAAVVLIGLDPSDAAQVQRAVGAAGGPPVISELDGVTAALGAAAVSLLRSRDITPRRGRIVVTGTDAAPRLGPLLTALGAGSMTTWHPHDAQDYPLQQVMAHNDLLIDLAGAAPDNAAPGRMLGLPSEPYDYAALVLPGLLSGLRRHAYRPHAIEVLAACSRALALVTGADRILPQIDERLLVPAVYRHVCRALCEDSRHRALAHREPSPQPSPTHDRYPEGRPQ